MLMKSHLVSYCRRIAGYCTDKSRTLFNSSSPPTNNDSSSPPTNSDLDFIRTFSFTSPSETKVYDDLSTTELSKLKMEYGWKAINRGQYNAVIASSPNSWFSFYLNDDVLLEIPRYTILTMHHCFVANREGDLKLLVETAHFNWLYSHISDNSLFLDVGAATGAMSLPFAIRFPAIRIVAFEPSARTRTVLEDSIDRNAINNITILPYAVSDTSGSFEFIELPEDSTGKVPFLPEGSRLSASNETLDLPNQKKYDVAVVTLDSLANELDFAAAGNIVIKIDVEGFEEEVLKGALELLSRYKPVLAIDIHPYPNTDRSTDKACMDILSPLGYTFERMGHVLLATVAQ